MDTDKAAIEAEFVGTRTGEFAGIQPAGRAVRVPCSVIYDLRPIRSARCRMSRTPDMSYKKPAQRTLARRKERTLVRAL
jgi:predicted ester cyclase